MKNYLYALLTFTSLLMSRTSTPSICINKEDINLLNAFFVGKITEISDKEIVVQRSFSRQRKNAAWVFSILFSLFAVYNTLSLIDLWRDGYANGLFIALFLLVLLPFYVLFAAIPYRILFLPDKQFVILDREHQKVTFPRHDFSMEHITCSYEDTNCWYQNPGRNSIYYATGFKTDSRFFNKILIYKAAPNQNHNTSLIIQSWDYISCYMNKEGELPPGSVFDKYR